jgi:HEPN domain-containing protein
MADSLNYNDWYYKAKTDIKTAKIIFYAEVNGENLDYSHVAFHCQQCIEKYLKGFLIKMTGKPVKKTHNLSYLHERVIEINVSFEKFSNDCDYVNKFYFDTRYPADFVIVKQQEARRCIDAANKIHEFILETETTNNEQ